MGSIIYWILAIIISIALESWELFAILIVLWLVIKLIWYAAKGGFSSSGTDAGVDFIDFGSFTCGGGDSSCGSSSCGGSSCGSSCGGGD